MKTAARFPLERIAALDRAIRAHEYPNARSFAERFEMAHRTGQRDLEFLRDRLGAPLEFDRQRNGYYYTDPSFRLPFHSPTEAEVVVVCEAEQVLADSYRGTPWADELARTFHRLTGGLTDRVRLRPGAGNLARSFRLSARATLDPDQFRELDAAILGRRRLAIRYRPAGEAGETRREVDPYHLASVDGQWYLVAFCHLRADVRLFVPGRILVMKPTGATFEPPIDFRLDDYFAGSLAVMRGREGESHRVRLRFVGTAAAFVRERTWHASQALEPTADGGFVLTLEVGHLREVERFALSWLPEVEVLEPPELRRRVVESASFALELHRNPDPPPRRPRAKRPPRRNRPDADD